MLEQFKTEVITIETRAFMMILDELRDIKEKVVNAVENANKPYLTTKEVMAMLGKSENWVLQHKDALGHSKSSGTLLFKRKDIDAYIESGYFKKGSRN